MNYFDWLPEDVLNYIYFLRWKSMILNIHTSIHQQYFKIIDATTSERIIHNQNRIKTKLIKCTLHSLDTETSLLKVVIWKSGPHSKRNTLIGADEKSTESYILP